MRVRPYGHACHDPWSRGSRRAVPRRAQVTVSSDKRIRIWALGPDSDSDDAAAAAGPEAGDARGADGWGGGGTRGDGDGWGDEDAVRT
jgi:hypothetical protein